jgi:hypothetical protein
MQIPSGAKFAIAKHADMFRKTSPLVRAGQLGPLLVVDGVRR